VARGGDDDRSALVTVGAPRALVLGGGVAGIAAAFGLRDRGFAVTLLESRGWLGGRAFSSADRGTGRELDNGPHVLLGCYRDFRALLRRLGTEDGCAAARTLTVAYRSAGGAAARLRLSRAPVPLALPFALRRPPWGATARWRALRGLLGALRAAPAEWTLDEWLRRRGQLGAPAAWLWAPLCRAIMNVGPASASAALFLATLREAFGGGAAAGAFLVPRQPWGRVLGGPARARLGAAGVQVRCGARVLAFLHRDGAIAAVRLGDGAELPVGAGDLVVSALPWHALAALLPAGAPFAALCGSPIVSAHFALAGDGSAPPDDGPITALVDGAPFHFLYRAPDARRGEFALIAGGSPELDGVGTAAIEQAARAQLRRHYPEFTAAAAGEVRIRKEARATFVAAPGSERLRPQPGPLPGGPRNLLVCGDWTATGLPSTLEGAARSATAMLAALG
jgi:squalene-associated FAD-dependent desaturase